MSWLLLCHKRLRKKKIGCRLTKNLPTLATHHTNCFLILSAALCHWARPSSPPATIAAAWNSMPSNPLKLHGFVASVRHPKAPSIMEAPSCKSQADHIFCHVASAIIERSPWNHRHRISTKLNPQSPMAEIVCASSGALKNLHQKQVNHPES